MHSQRDFIHGENSYWIYSFLSLHHEMNACTFDSSLELISQTVSPCTIDSSPDFTNHAVNALTGYHYTLNSDPNLVFDALHSFPDLISQKVSALIRCCYRLLSHLGLSFDALHSSTPDRLKGSTYFVAQVGDRNLQSQES